MSEPKTKINNASVVEFIDSVVDEQKRNDCFRILNLMQEITGEEPKMWGSSIVGFGTYHYVYESGRDGNWFLTGFSPRKRNLTMYIMTGLIKYQSLLEKLGKHKIGKSCLYVNRLSDIDIDVLRELITESSELAKSKHVE